MWWFVLYFARKDQSTATVQGMAVAGSEKQAIEGVQQSLLGQGVHQVRVESIVTAPIEDVIRGTAIYVLTFLTQLQIGPANRKM